MNRNLATMILTAAVSATLGVTSLQAQQKAVADIPFAFQVQSQTMPAGKYTVENSIAGNATLFGISDHNGHSRFVGAPVEGKANPTDSKLVFMCTNGQYTLATIDLPGSSVSHSLVQRNSSRNIGMASMVSVRVSR